MSDTKYTVTFRMAERGVAYDNPNDKEPAHDSVAGHLWYVLRQNGEVVRSTGFSPKNGKVHDDGQVASNDEKIIETHRLPLLFKSINSNLTA